MKTQIENQLEALQNAGTCYGLTIHIFHSEDKRKAPLFFAQKGNATISPNLDYSNLNHFLLGYGEALKLSNQKHVLSADKWVLDFIDGVEPTTYRGNVDWYKNDKLLFTQDFKDGWLWVSWYRIGSVLEGDFGLSNDEAKELLTKVLCDYTDNGKLKVTL